LPVILSLEGHRPSISPRRNPSPSDVTKTALQFFANSLAETKP